MPEDPRLSVRVLTAADAPAYREVRLAGFRNDPLAFVTTAGEYGARPLSEIAARLDPTLEVVNFGAFQGGGLVGILTVLRETRPTLAHRALIVGVSVLPEARGRGAGAALVGAGVAQARAWTGVTSLHLSVTETQDAARRLYERHGFRVWGTEPDAVRHGETVYAQHHLWLDLKESRA
ncbi:N-acetyltransferase [Deinococcus aetherius]|uniref:N-acetyltransferase n=1 Tax=Deinococcus aetherius TaxID=200252 RepID=A0ABM8A8M8_9DEIO|nr:GNAT family N-acetyltransferase [Deinococcus aetherius]BDP40094.1 N-acetyltransferase [Deinococcus aetherius]